MCTGLLLPGDNPIEVKILIVIKKLEFLLLFVTVLTIFQVVLVLLLEFSIRS